MKKQTEREKTGANWTKKTTKNTTKMAIPTNNEELRIEWRSEKNPFSNNYSKLRFASEIPSCLCQVNWIKKGKIIKNQQNSQIEK